VARGGTTAVWTTTDNTPSNPFGGDWDLRVPGGGDNDLHGSMGYVYLSGQTQQSYSDDVTYGTAREATALVLAISVGGGDILAVNSGEGTLSATLVEPFQPDTGILRGDGTVLRAYMRRGELLLPVANPSFDDDAVGWFGFGGSVDRSTGQFNTSPASGLLTPDGVTATPVVGLDPSSSPLASEGQVLRPRIWVMSLSGWSNVLPAIAWVDGGGATISEPTGDPVDLEAGVWTELEMVGRAPVGTVRISPRVWVANTPSASDVVFVDDVSITLEQVVELSSPFILPSTE
jgi:hypothetical protein